MRLAFVRGSRQPVCRAGRPAYVSVPDVHGDAGGVGWHLSGLFLCSRLARGREARGAPSSRGLAGLYHNPRRAWPQ